MAFGGLGVHLLPVRVSGVVGLGGDVGCVIFPPPPLGLVLAFGDFLAYHHWLVRAVLGVACGGVWCEGAAD